jgi:hypothetical protein
MPLLAYTLLLIVLLLFSPFILTIGRRENA